MAKREPKSVQVGLRINLGTFRRLLAEAAEKGVPLGTHMRQLLEDYAPARDTQALKKATGRLRK